MKKSRKQRPSPIIKGFCLEFDTSFEPFTKAQKVQYSNQVPSVSPACLLLGDVYNVMMSMVTVKSSHWSYEKEWRIFHMEPNKAFGIDIKCLTGIYFGAAMKFSHKEIIAMILRDSPTKLNNALRDQYNFQISFEEVNYTPFNYNK